MDENQMGGQSPAPVNTPPAVPPTPPSSTGEGRKPGKNTFMAVVAYILFFVPLLTEAKNDPFVKFHVKQGLVLLLTSIAVGILGAILPYGLWLAVGWILNLGILVLLVIGIINAVNGKEEKLPVIGQFADKFKF